jgi:hypothetical protein
MIQFFKAIVMRIRIGTDSIGLHCTTCWSKPGKIPYSSVRKRLIDSLVVSAIDSGECAAYEKPDSLLREMSLARVYASRFFESEEATEDEKTEAVKRADSLGVKNPDWYYESKIAEIQAWIDKMTIRIP